jgi:hypothetical protein
MTPGNQHALERILGERGSLPLAPEQSRKVQWTIVVDNEPAGWVSLDVTSRDHHIGSVGYALAPAYHGRGIASGALRQVIGIAFDPDQLSLDRSRECRVPARPRKVRLPLRGHCHRTADHRRPTRRPCPLRVDAISA